MGRTPQAGLSSKKNDWCCSSTVEEDRRMGEKKRKMWEIDDWVSGLFNKATLWFPLQTSSSCSSQRCGHRRSPQIRLFWVGGGERAAESFEVQLKSHSIRNDFTSSGKEAVIWRDGRLGESKPEDGNEARERGRIERKKGSKSSQQGSCCQKPLDSGHYSWSLQ